MHLFKWVSTIKPLVDCLNFVGISPVHLLSAAFMSAPASMAIAKVIYPETKKQEKTSQLKISKLKASNILEAATIGIQDSIPAVAGLVACLIGFVAVQSYLDSLVAWLGESIGFDNWSFDLLLSYLFYPFVFFMGVERTEILTVSKLVGQKTFFNEFVAYDTLSEMIKLREKYSLIILFANTLCQI